MRITEFRISKRTMEYLKNLIFTAFILSLLIFYYPKISKNLKPWYNPVVTPEEVEAAEWVDNTIPIKRLFACDAFACEMLMAVAGEKALIGGAWENAIEPLQKFWDNKILFTTNSSDEAYEIAKKYNVEYIFTKQRYSYYGYGWETPNIEKFDDDPRFSIIYDKDDVKIYEVL